MSLLEMSLMGGALILCILLLRLLTRGRLSAGILSAMWAATLLRLLVPVDIRSPLSIMGLVNRRPLQVMALPAQPVSNVVPPSPLTLVWLCGAALCGLFFLMLRIRQGRALKMALPAPMTRELEAALAVQGLARKAAVYTSDRVATPLTYGIIKPRIVLPSHMALTGAELSFVIAHECAHIKKRDAVKKYILLTAVCLHWFNPLIWLMAAVYRRDMELSCDSQVLKAYGPQMRAAYARTLLGLEERKRFSGVLMECFSASPLEQRIRSIMTGGRTTMAGALAAVAVFGCAAAAFATSPGPQAAVTVNTAVSIAAFDLRQMQAPEAAIYVWNGDVWTAGYPGTKLAVPAAKVMGQVSAGTFLPAGASAALELGDAVTVISGQAYASAVSMPVYSVTYTAITP